MLLRTSIICNMGAIHKPRSQIFVYILLPPPPLWIRFLNKFYVVKWLPLPPQLFTWFMDAFIQEKWTEKYTNISDILGTRKT